VVDAGGISATGGVSNRFSGIIAARPNALEVCEAFLLEKGQGSQYKFSMKIPSIFAGLILLTGCATGSHIITGTVRAPISPAAVKIYAAAPASAEVIGIVSASNAASLTWQGATDKAVADLKKEAAEIGANGLIITDQKNDLNNGSMVSGTAIFVNSDKSAP
jgi:hypothetical protein